MSSLMVGGGGAKEDFDNAGVAARLGHLYGPCLIAVEDEKQGKWWHMFGSWNLHWPYLALV